MTRTTATLRGVTQEQFLKLLDGYEGLEVTGAQEEEMDGPEAPDVEFYDAGMWENHVKSYGFGKYDHIDVRTVFSTEDGSPLFCYLALVGYCG